MRRRSFVLAFLGMALVPAHAASAPNPPAAAWVSEHGWRAKYQADLAKPAVLLIHGLAATGQTWTDPRAQWNIRKIAYDPKSEPHVDDASAKHPFRHEWSSGAPGENFWDALAKDFSVATWNQVPCIAAASVPSTSCLASDSFERAYESATWALAKLLAETKGPVILLAHSRGGLVARRLLKEFGDANGRIKQLITLHSPHGGTYISSKPNAIYDDAEHLLADILPVKSWREEVIGRLEEVKAAVLQVAGFPGARELAPDLVPAAVRSGEKPLPGVAYTTFGGTSTTIVRLHTRRYTETKKPPFFTKELTVHPFFGASSFDETTNGKGDAMVTDGRARAPWLGARHFTNPLHHGEVLWSGAVIRQVHGIIGQTPANPK